MWICNGICQFHQGILLQSSPQKADTTCVSEGEVDRIPEEHGQHLCAVTPERQDSMSNPHEASTDEDRESLALTCVWKGDADSAEFYALNVVMYHAPGRHAPGQSSEVARSQKQHLTVKEKHEPFLNYPVVSHWLQQHKNNKEQDLDMFPHRVSDSGVVILFQHSMPCMRIGAFIHLVHCILYPLELSLCSCRYWKSLL